MTDFFKHIIEEFQLPLSNPVLIFSLILLIILLSPILLRRINIPGIIGLILSGVIIGPKGLNILEKTSAIDLFSTIGLLYIMFIAGLELDMNEFKANRYKSIVFGFFTFAIPLAIGYPVCFYFLKYDFNASLLTASMFATHTLVAYPIVSKMGISKNQAVAISVGGTILTDTAVLIILAVILANSGGQLSRDFWIQLSVSLTIFTLIMFLFIPRISKWFFRKLESENHAHYIYVLSVVFFAAFLAEIAGVEPIIGAFVAGLTLNRLIPHSSALMNRIEFIGNALFIPFFLISVGMVVDIGVILKGPVALIVAGTLTVAALFGKWLAAWFTQLLFRYSSSQRQLIFGLSSAHAAATLAVILVGYRANIIDENILNGTIILILITCLVATIVTDKAARKVLLSGENDELSSQEKLRLIDEHILIPVASDDHIEKLLEFGLMIKDKKSANPITILSVVPNNEEAEINILKSRKKLDEFVKQGAANETKVNTIATIDYNPANGIARVSREIMADIIILGWPSKAHLLDKIMGEIVPSIVQNVDKNIFISQLEKPFITHKRIFLVTPTLAEKEPGFETWVMKIIRLAQEQAIQLVHYGQEKTNQAISLLLKNRKINIPFSYQVFTELDDFLILSREMNPDDLLVVTLARKATISYSPKLDLIPGRLDRYFADQNKILIYPQQPGNGHPLDN